MNHILNLDSNFKSFLLENSMTSKIVDLFLYNKGEFLNRIGDYIKQENIDSISYIPNSKLNLQHLGFDEVKNRVVCKIGKFAQKSIKSDILEFSLITPKDISDFVNLFKSYFDTDTSKLKVVEGDEIYNWYLYSNYCPIEKGTLWKSCMRYSDKNHYMELYAKNSNNCKLLIYLDDSDKLIARALLWFDCQDEFGNSYNVMDRIYSIYDHNQELFKKWAQENGFLHKKEQSSKSERLFIKDGEITKLNLKIKLETNRINYFPYLDTFKYYNHFKGLLFNYESINYSYILTRNDGLLEDEIVEDDEFYFDEDF